MSAIPAAFAQQSVRGTPVLLPQNKPLLVACSFVRSNKRLSDFQLYQQRSSSSPETMDTSENSTSYSTFELSSEEALQIEPSEGSILNASHSNRTLHPEHPEGTGSLVWFESDLLKMPPESVLWLNAVAIVWGSQHPIIKMVVQDCDTSAFSLARFGLAALLASPYTPGLFNLKDDLSQDEQSTAVATAWRWGVEMGMWMFLGYAFQAIGLEYTTAQRSGFLLYLNVKFVPFFAFLLFGRQISVPTWASALTALVGTAMLAGGNLQDLNIGDAWSIAAAAASAMFILRLESASMTVPNSAQLNAACLWVVTILALLWSLAQNGLLSSPLDAWQETVQNVVDTATTHPWELVYLGGVTTALANYMQTRAQKGVSAERASVIYAMDPVYGAGFSNLLLGEQLKGWGIAGAGLITLAAATNAFLDFGKTKENPKRANEMVVTDYSEDESE